MCAIFSGALAFIGPAYWRRIFGATGYLWVGALAAGISANSATDAMRMLWPLAVRVTFALVRFFVQPFGTFTADPSAMTIGNSRITIEIAPTCSGLEGVGLVLA